MNHISSPLRLMYAFVSFAATQILLPAIAFADLSQSPPNVILILADDLAIGDLGAMDGHASRTPQLDRLASQSVRFENAYSGSCVCAPARAALLTGRYPHRTGVVTLNMNKYPQLTQLRRDEVTIADMLAGAGYRTGLIGKWHLGNGPEFQPRERGFKVSEYFSGSSDMSYFDYVLDINGKRQRVNDGTYLTDDLSDRAIEFVRENRDQPFFLHLAHYAPHRPLQAPEDLIELYRAQGYNDSTATIYAMINVMDRGIGRLLDELDSLQLSNRTIVIFTSDNGPDPVTGQRFNHGMRGTKYQVYEGGIRVPLFVQWQGHFPPGARTQRIHFVDLLPTILGLCNVDLTHQNSLDGESFLPVLQDSTSPFAPIRFWQWNRGNPNYTHNAAIRDGRFKLVRPYVTRSDKISDSTLPPSLYDLETDPTESEDVSHRYPAVTSRLAGQLQSWTVDIENDRTRPQSQK